MQNQTNVPKQTGPLGDASCRGNLIGRFSTSADILESFLNLHSTEPVI